VRPESKRHSSKQRRSIPQALPPKELAHPDQRQHEVDGQVEAKGRWEGEEPVEENRRIADLHFRIRKERSSTEREGIPHGQSSGVCSKDSVNDSLPRVVLVQDINEEEHPPADQQRREDENHKGPQHEYSLHAAKPILGSTPSRQEDSSTRRAKVAGANADLVRQIDMAREFR
jgi:hypothetical protein